MGTAIHGGCHGHGSVTDLHLETFGAGERAVFVHGSFGWGLDTFPDQRALADEYEVVLVDRRGFGASPSSDDPGWHHDMADVAEVLGEGAHLVGQSYGAVGCLLAAGLRPEAVRSLTVIEPVASSVARGDSAADAFEAALHPVYEHAGDMTAEAFLDAWSRALGRTGGADTSRLSDEDRAAMDASRRERWPGDAPIDVEALAGSRFPKLVVMGGWPGRPGPDLLRDAAATVCRSLHEAIGGRLELFEGSAHNPQMEEPERFNRLLREFWAGSPSPPA